MRRFVILLAALLSGPASAMSLSSSDFADGGTIPQVHFYPRCGGQNVSPALSWKGVPQSAKSLYLTMIDTDVPPNLWSHWIVIDIPPSATGLPRDLKALPAGAHGVQSNFGDTVYDGPCPPVGSGTHHYRFTLWAIGTSGMHIGGNVSAMDLQTALSQLAIDRASVTGTVRR